MSGAPLADRPSRRSCDKPARAMGKTLQLRPIPWGVFVFTMSKILRRCMVNLQPSGVFFGVQDRHSTTEFPPYDFCPASRGVFFWIRRPPPIMPSGGAGSAKPLLLKKVTILSNDAPYLLLHFLHWLAHEGVRLKAGHRVKRSMER